MNGRSEVASLVELIVGCQNYIVGNKHQSKRITERILSLLSLPVSDVNWFVVYALLAKIFGFIAQFVNESYFISTWMNTDDDFTPFYSELDLLIESMGLNIPFSSEDRARDASADADEMVLYIQRNLESPTQLTDKSKDVIQALSYSEALSNGQSLPTLNIVDKKLLCPDAVVVGRGRFGAVKKTNLRGVPVAVKPLASSSQSGVADAQLLVDLHREAMLLQLCNMQGVIRYIGVDDAVRPTTVYTELALCSLRDALFTEHYRGIIELTLSSKLAYLTTLCSTFAHIHSLGIVHRDIKSTNVLVCSDLTLKVSDFGFTRCKLFINSAGGQPEGSCAYMAPELLMYQEKYQYSQSTDMYAFSVLMNEVLTQRVPLSGMPAAQVLARMYQTNGTIRPDLYAGEQAQSVDSVITSGWHVDPQSRLTFQQLLTHLQMLEAVVSGLDSLCGTPVASSSSTGSDEAAAASKKEDVELSVIDDSR